MSLRFYEIAERFHLIQNPITSEKLDAVGAGCRFAAGTRLLDLGCGRGEMLTRWAERYAITGTGVDISTTYLAEASRRAAARNVAESVRFVELDAARYFEENPAEQGAFDVVSCIGATWIGGGTPGTLAIMKQGLKDPSTGMLLVGDVYWHNPPTDEQIKANRGTVKQPGVDSPYRGRTPAENLDLLRRIRHLPGGPLRRGRQYPGARPGPPLPQPGAAPGDPPVRHVLPPLHAQAVQRGGKPAGAVRCRRRGGLHPVPPGYPGSHPIRGRSPHAHRRGAP